jgi:hypothetical protein
MASSLGALIGPLFDAAESPKEQKKRTPKPKSKKSGHGTAKFQTTEGEGSVAQQGQQHGELAASMAPKPPTPQEQTHDHARSAKVRATQDWVEGRITSKQHANVHERANHILMNRQPKVFKGSTGEKAPKKGMGVHGW